jgi:hypothetical protein
MTEQAESWVVYLMTTHQKPEGMRALCEQSEWDKMEQANPGYHKLIQGGIRSERDAELLARGTSGDARARTSKPR